MTTRDVFLPFMFTRLIGCENFGGLPVPLKACTGAGSRACRHLCFGACSLHLHGDFWTPFLPIIFRLALLASNSISAFASDLLQPCLPAATAPPRPAWDCICCFCPAPCGTDPYCHHCHSCCRRAPQLRFYFPLVPGPSSQPGSARRVSLLPASTC